MPLTTASQRRSSVGLLQPWQANAPSPTDSPGVIDRADREQIAWSYSGIPAAHPVPIPHGMHAFQDRLRRGRGWQDHLRAGFTGPGVLRVGQSLGAHLVV